MAQKKPAKKPKLSDTVGKPSGSLDWQGRYDKADGQIRDLDAQIQPLLKASGGRHTPQIQQLLAQQQKLFDRRTKLIDIRDNPGNQGPGSGGGSTGGDVADQQPSNEQPLTAPGGPSNTAPPVPGGPTSPVQTPGGPGSTPAQGMDPSQLQSYGQTPGAPPTQDAFQYQQGGASDLLNNIAQQSTEGTLNSFNTSANRLRERLDSAGAGAADAARNRNLSRGFGNSGINDASLNQVNANTQNAYGQGLNDLSNQFEQNRQRGLENAGQIGGRLLGNEEGRNQLNQGDLAQRRDANNSNWQFGEGQKQQNNQFIDSTLTNLLNNREGRMSDWDIEQLRSQLQREGYGSQERIAQLIQKGENYRQAIGVGDDKYGTPGATNGSTGGTVGSPPTGGNYTPPMRGSPSGGGVEVPLAGGGKETPLTASGGPSSGFRSMGTPSRPPLSSSFGSSGGGPRTSDIFGTQLLGAPAQPAPPPPGPITTQVQPTQRYGIGTNLANNVIRNQVIPQTNPMRAGGPARRY